MMSDAVDFRDVDAIDQRTAYVLSIGNGLASRIYKTTDSGATWALQFKNEDPKAFFDAMSFWDAKHGIVFGDSIDGEFCIMTTGDGGQVWSRVPSSALPPALENEGAFAASGTNVAIFGKTHAWIGTGAAAKARVLRTSDWGRTWAIPAHSNKCCTIDRHLLHRFPRCHARSGRRWRLQKGDGSKQQRGDNQRRRSNLDSSTGPLRFSFSGGICSGIGHVDPGCCWPIGEGILKRTTVTPGNQYSSQPGLTLLVLSTVGDWAGGQA